MAVSIVPVMSEPANGVSAPSASSVPPSVSAVPAARACWRPGRSSSLCMVSEVPSIPEPPNQPNSF